MGTTMGIIVLAIFVFMSLYYIYWHDMKFDWFKSLKLNQRVRADFALYGGSSNYVTLEVIVKEKHPKGVSIDIDPAVRALAIKQYGPDGLLITEYVDWHVLHPANRKEIYEQDCFKCHNFILFKIWTLKREYEQMKSYNER